MSNLVVLNSTTFKDHTGESKGYLIQDNYDCSHEKDLETVPTGLDLLTLAMQSDNPVIISIIDSLVENDKGIKIDGEWYDWDDIKHLWWVKEEE